MRVAALMVVCVGLGAGCLVGQTIAYHEVTPAFRARAPLLVPTARFPSVRALGNALLAFASPKAALTWANTFSDAEGVEEKPAPSIPLRSVARWIVAALVILGAAGAITWGGDAGARGVKEPSGAAAEDQRNRPSAGAAACS